LSLSFEGQLKSLRKAQYSYFERELKRTGSKHEINDQFALVTAKLY